MDPANINLCSHRSAPDPGTRLGLPWPPRDQLPYFPEEKTQVGIVAGMCPSHVASYCKIHPEAGIPPVRMQV